MVITLVDYHSSFSMRSSLVVPFHLDYSTLMQHRSELDCKSIVLTHMSSDMLRHVPELALQAAHDGLELTL